MEGGFDWVAPAEVVCLTDGVEMVGKELGSVVAAEGAEGGGGVDVRGVSGASSVDRGGAGRGGADDIRSMILTVRGKQVLLDSDVALLYGYETKQINRAATRNKERFPEEFRFQLTKAEAQEVPRCQFGTLNNSVGLGVAQLLRDDYCSRSQFGTLNNIADVKEEQVKGTGVPDGERSRSQIVTLNAGRGTNIKYQPYVYTEQGIAMLSGLLKNDTAVQVSINIMNAFVEMRKYIYANKNVFDNIVNINNKLVEHDQKFDEVFALLNAPEANRQWIFYQGQFFDAFEWMERIIARAASSIVVIDSYTDESTLELLTKKKASVKEVVILTANPGRIAGAALRKWTEQYGELTVIRCDKFHDRFVILDDREVYAIGASLKDLGKKCFAVSKNEDTKQFVDDDRKEIMRKLT
jgi:hypothetical protein